MADVGTRALSWRTRRGSWGLLPSPLHPAPRQAGPGSRLRLAGRQPPHPAGSKSRRGGRHVSQPRQAGCRPPHHPDQEQLPSPHAHLGSPRTQLRQGLGIHRRRLLILQQLLGGCLGSGRACCRLRGARGLPDGTGQAHAGCPLLNVLLATPARQGRGGRRGWAQARGEGEGVACPLLNVLLATPASQGRGRGVGGHRHGARERVLPAHLPHAKRGGGITCTCLACKEGGASPVHVPHEGVFLGEDGLAGALIEGKGPGAGGVQPGGGRKLGCGRHLQPHSAMLC